VRIGTFGTLLNLPSPATSSGADVHLNSLRSPAATTRASGPVRRRAPPTTSPAAARPAPGLGRLV